MTALPRTFAALVVLVLGIVAVAAVDQVPAQAVQQPPTVTINGRVVDASGNGVAGAKLATNWVASDGQALNAGSNAPVTASDGTFSHAFPIYDFPVVLMAIDAHRKIGGTVLIEKNPGDAKVTIKAQPLATLRLKARLDAPGSYAIGINVMHPEPRVPIAFVGAPGTTVDVAMPAGTYELFVASMETNSVTKSIEFKPGATETVEIELKVSGLAKSYGKEALPLTFSEVRGVDPRFKLADLKGKWVLLEFWGFW